MRFKSKLLLCTFTALAGIASACEPECRHSIAEAFAERYIPVVQRSVSDLNDLLYENLYNVPIPEKLLEFVPEDVLRQGVRDNLENGLETFVDQLNVTDGIYLTLFSGDQPFKGDCNDPPRLTRKKPPVGESWTLEECEKMDYICGNPPSICHFLDTIKQRIVDYLRMQLRTESAFGKGLLFQSVAPRMKQDLRATILRYGAGSLQKDPEVTSYINDLIFKMLSTLKLWLATDVENMCSRQDDYDLCEGWDDSIKQEILKWP